jgi:cytochrome c biogenesis protein
MSESVRTGTLSTAQDPLDEVEGAELRLPVTDLADRLWHVFISMRTGLALILFLALLGLVGALVAQVPAGLAADPASYRQWLEGVRPKYGGWTNVLDALGLFAVFSSVWFKGTVVLLSTSLVACSVNRTPLLWRQAVHPRTVVSAGFIEHAPLSERIETAAVPATASAVLEGQLRSRGFRTIVAAEGAATALYADRFRWSPFGTVVAHLSLLFVLAGAMLGTTGFRVEDFAITIGSRVAVGNGTNLEVEAVSFSDSYYDDGRPSDYASHLIVYENGVQVAERTIRVNDPLRYGDVAFFQSFFGPAADIHVADAAGTAVFDGGVPLLWSSTDNTKSIGRFDVPSSDLVVYVIGAASGRIDPTIKAGQMQLEVYQGDASAPIAVEVLDQGQPVSIAGLEFTFERERQYTGLIASRDPGAPLVWLGTILLVGGVALVFFFPSRRLWARIRPSGDGTAIEVAAVTRHDVSFEAAFGSLIDDVRLGLGPSLAHSNEKGRS